MDSRPISLRARIDISPSSAQTRRFLPITRLFNTLDAQLVDCINGTCVGTAGGCDFDIYRAMVVQQNIESIQPEEDLSEVQLADVLLTKEWLQTKVWQVCVSHSALVFASPFIELRVEYPLVKLVKAIEAVRSSSDEALRGNGQCMVSSYKTHIRVDIYRRAKSAS